MNLGTEDALTSRSGPGKSLYFVSDPQHPIYSLITFDLDSDSAAYRSKEKPIYAVALLARHPVQGATPKRASDRPMIHGLLLHKTVDETFERLGIFSMIVDADQVRLLDEVLGYLEERIIKII